MPEQDRKNRLLTLLSDRDYEFLRPHLSEIDLPYKHPLYSANEPIEDCYFLIDGVASLVNTMSDGRAAEVGTIGNEGVVGLPIVLGDATAPTSVYMQVPGKGLKIRSQKFSDAFEKCPTLKDAILRYVHAFFNQVAQSAACAHFHSLDQRCCRWLLMTRDRMPSDDIMLTQEFLAMMLGVTRPGVSGVMSEIQKAGMATYSRGSIKILDRAALEKRSCECYAVSKAEFDLLLGGTPQKPRADRTGRSASQVG